MGRNLRIGKSFTAAHAVIERSVRRKESGRAPEGASMGMILVAASGLALTTDAVVGR